MKKKHYLLFTLFSFLICSQSCEQKPLSLDQKMEILKNDPDFIAYCQMLNEEAIKVSTGYYGKGIYDTKPNTKEEIEQLRKKISKMKDVEELKAELVSRNQSQGMLHAQENVDFGFNVFKYSKILFDRYEFLREMSSKESAEFMTKVQNSSPELKLDPYKVIDARKAQVKN